MAFFKSGKKKTGVRKFVEGVKGAKWRIDNKWHIFQEGFPKTETGTIQLQQDSKTEAGAILRWDDKATAGQAKISSPSTLLHFIARHISHSLLHHHHHHHHFYGLEYMFFCQYPKDSATSFWAKIIHWSLLDSFEYKFSHRHFQADRFCWISDEISEQGRQGRVKRLSGRGHDFAANEQHFSSGSLNLNFFSPPRPLWEPEAYFSKSSQILWNHDEI